MIQKIGLLAVAAAVIAGCSGSGSNNNRGGGGGVASTPGEGSTFWVALPARGLPDVALQG
jgi:hypothetical protein